MTDKKLLETINKAVFSEWVTTIDEVARTYHGDNVALETMQGHASIVNQMAKYYTSHEMEFTGVESAEGIEDEVSEMDVADLYHFLRWQATEYDIWKN